MAIPFPYRDPRMVMGVKSPYGNGDPHMEMGTHQSPFPYGDPHIMETGIMNFSIPIWKR